VTAVASQRITDALRTEILDGGYQPGQRIKQEDIAARLGASRIPVREALRMLQAEGLVTLVANSGAWVARLSLAECAELYQIRERLEPLLCGRRCPASTARPSTGWRTSPMPWSERTVT
jgi:DNA-binding GntR family transcriptional regulator